MCGRRLCSSGGAGAGSARDNRETDENRKQRAAHTTILRFDQVACAATSERRRFDQIACAGALGGADNPRPRSRRGMVIGAVGRQSNLRLRIGA